ncbi:MAG TPA: hypothetical protein VER96_24325 [Polyangiaceae bacterium]|nr:hypothetical protein [Polyangiaceae bacterium]
MTTSSLVLNPFAALTHFEDDERGQCLLVGAALRGTSTRYTLLAEATDSELFARLRQYSTPRAGAYSLFSPMLGERSPLWRWRRFQAFGKQLQALGLLAASRQLPRPVPFECPLSLERPRALPRGGVPDFRDQVLRAAVFELLPLGRRAGRARQQGLVLPRGAAPPNLWVQDPTTRASFPHWASPHFERLLKRIEPGEDLSGLERTELQALLRAGLACGERQLEEGAEAWSNLPIEARNSLTERGFYELQRVLPSSHVAALRRYYRGRIREGLLPYVDQRGERRFVSHNDPLAAFYQRQLLPLMQRLTGTRLKPSLVAVSAYQSGAQLETHVDGDGSDWNVSLQTDFTPEPRGATPWPLTFGAQEACKSAVRLGLGDAVVYRGNAVPHGRPCLGDAQRSTTLVFHYRAAKRESAVK